MSGPRDRGAPPVLSSLALIDLHTHVLPGLDDGAPDADAALALARAIAEGGVRTVVATPHVNSTYANDPDTVAAGVSELNAALRERAVPLEVLTGAEIALPQLAEMGDADLARHGLGGGRCVLVESPYVRAVSFLEDLLEDVRGRGYLPLLAHPERSPLFQEDPGRLERLVSGGVVCSVTAGSLAGRFGRTVRRFALDLARRGLVHDVSSDAHDLRRRPPGLAVPAELAPRAGWLTLDAPAALLEGRMPPAPPPLRGAGLRRFLGRSQ